MRAIIVFWCKSVISLKTPNKIVADWTQAGDAMLQCMLAAALRRRQRVKPEEEVAGGMATPCPGDRSTLVGPVQYAKEGCLVSVQRVFHHRTVKIDARARAPGAPGLLPDASSKYCVAS